MNDLTSKIMFLVIAETKEIYDLYYKIYIELPFDGKQISSMYILI